MVERHLVARVGLDMEEDFHRLPAGGMDSLHLRGRVVQAGQEPAVARPVQRRFHIGAAHRAEGTRRDGLYHPSPVGGLVLGRGVACVDQIVGSTQGGGVDG